MKYILTVILSLCLSFTLSAESYGNGLDIRIVTIENHDYIVSTLTDWKSGGGVSMIHAESCPCKNAIPTNSVSKTEKRLFSKSMRLKKYEEQNGICTHCTNRFDFSEMEGDHIIPYSKGGKTVYENLQMLCIPCNRKKGNRYDY